ncbi:MAG: hypothetical protein D6766_12325 [Verrucomicrobia bacterium]|nr:MAG: hypothetical protein D6766_12325 [Verrucomicrobiota bacterium]
MSEWLVREFFELHGFLVRQARKYVTPGGRDEEAVDLLVWNPRAETAGEPLPIELTAEWLGRIPAALVAVKGWHTETFSRARLEGTPELFRFLEPSVVRRATRELGGTAAPLKLLVAPALPRDKVERRASLEWLRARGVDGVIEFRTVVGELVRNTEVNRNYEKSDLLQVIRVLKKHGFLQGPQMELFRPRRGRRRQGGESQAG